MKRILTCLLAGIMLLTVTACGAKTEQPAETTPAEEAAPMEEATPIELPAEAPMEPVWIEDAAIYRGTLTAAEDTEQGKLITLEQAKGSDYGAPSKQFLLTESTRQSYPAEALENGSYMEIFYNDAELPEAVGANILFPAEMVNFNGTFEEIMWNDENLPADGGRLVMTDMNTGETIEFNFQDGYTVFYVKPEELQKGDKLNIYHRGMYTMSIPAQGSAVEVRPYAE